MPGDNPAFLAHTDVQRLLDALLRRGLSVIGPRVHDGAIAHVPLSDAAELPRGVTDEQAPGRYRLQHTPSTRLFAWANGPQALKPLLFAAEEPLWSSSQSAEGTLSFSRRDPAAAALAVVGVRACDLAALAIHDRHFANDSHYQARRRGLFLVAVNCSHPAATCFCHSTGDGPASTEGYDLVLDELEDGLLLRAGSEAGNAVLQTLELAPAGRERHAAAAKQREAAVRAMSRRLPDADIATTLAQAGQHPHWDEVAARCLSCANCTSVCPTCFCYRESDQAGLDGSSLRSRQWDSCFSPGHSYIHGKVIRVQPRHRYRQWLTHKLSAWQVQFGRSGCVGCGRCISWCPVGIDITAEVAAICAGSSA